MTEKRFQWVFIKDNELEFQDNGIVKRFNNDRLEEFLNEFHDENEQLKTQLQNTSDQRDEFHRGARENANYVEKLEKENEQLKEQLKNLRRLVNEAYMEGSE